MSHTLIVGNGYLAKRLSYHMKKKGKTYTIAARHNPRHISYTTKGAENMLKAAKELRGKKVDDVVVLTGYPVLTPFAWNNESKLRESRNLVSRNVVQQILDLPTDERPSTFLQGSAVGIYPYDPATYTRLAITRPLPCVDMMTPTVGQSWLSRMLYDLESESAPLDEAGIRRVMIRTPVVVGAEAPAIVPSLKFPMSLGDGKNIWPWIYQDDWTALVDFMIEHKELAGAVNATSPQLITQEQLLMELCSYKRLPMLRKPFYMPDSLIPLLFGREKSELVLQSQYCPMNPAVLKAGFVCQTPDLQDAMQLVLDNKDRPLVEADFM